MHYFSVHIGESVVAALVAKGHPLVIESHEVQDGRIEIVNVDRIFDHFVTQIVRPTVNDPWPYSGPGEPYRESVALVIAADIFRGDTGSSYPLSDRRASEFGGHDDQGLVEHTALLQISYQSRTGTIDLLGRSRQERE